MARRCTIDERVAQEIRTILQTHPDYRQKRLEAALATKGIEVDASELRRFLRTFGNSASGRSQHWAESPLDPLTWRHPPTRYG
jgi:transposase